MIFAVLGTHTQPFPRALDLLRDLTESEAVTVQVGYTRPLEHPNLTCHEYLDFSEVERLMHEASAVVCHAGVGTILTAVHAGHQPVVIPRLREFHEHVDDHQLQLAIELERRGTTLCYRRGDSLADLVESSARSERASEDQTPGAVALGAAIRDEVLRACGSGRAVASAPSGSRVCI